MSPSIETRENRAFAAEIKFLVTPELAEGIRSWAASRLSPDPHAALDASGSYQITSLYFDTEQFDVFQRNGSYRKSKLRIRRYGSEPRVFLERKLKTRGLLTKRRSSVALAEIEQLSRPLSERDWAGSWFHRRLLVRRLRPVAQISYRRTALVAASKYGSIRLTLDHEIEAWPLRELEFHSTAEDGLPVEPRVILELKYCVAMPLLFKLLAEEFALKPQPISKYRLAAAALGLVTPELAPLPDNPDSLCQTS